MFFFGLLVSFYVLGWFFIVFIFSVALLFLVPRPPRSAVTGDYWIRVRQSVCLSVRLSVCLSTFHVGFYSATELQNYWAESNQTFYNERIYIEVVHLGIGFVVRPKLGSYDLVKNEEFQHNLEFAIPRPNSNYVSETNETFYNERIYIEVVHLGTGYWYW